MLTPPPLPLPISLEDVKICLLGEGLKQFLKELGTSAVADRAIEKATRFAVNEVERLSHTYLIQRRIHAYPSDGERGTDYDVLEDAYTWFPEEWKGTPEIRLKKRPLVSIEDLGIKYGQSEQQLQWLLPDAWKVMNRKQGILHIQPIVAMSSASSASAVLLPIFTMDSRRKNTPLACIVHVNYTAGYLPADFDAEIDDPTVASPDHDVTGLLMAVTYKAAANLLMKASIASDSDSGSISVDGASETITQGRYDKVREALEAKATKLLAQYGADEESSDEAEPISMIIV